MCTDVSISVLVRLSRQSLFMIRYPNKSILCFRAYLSLGTQAEFGYNTRTLYQYSGYRDPNVLTNVW